MPVMQQGLAAHAAAHAEPGAAGTPPEHASLGGLAARLASKVAKAEARLASLAPAPDSALNFRPAVRAVLKRLTATRKIIIPLARGPE